MTNETRKESVRAILENASAYEWSLQGLGMLRLYLSENVRLHVWDSNFAVPGVSRMHTHPWDFESTIVVGELTNCLWKETKRNGSAHYFNRQLLQCGPGGCLKGEPDVVRLGPLREKTYGEGKSYREQAEQIHSTRALRGTVTIVRREFKADRDHAHVFWPVGTEWGSAEPRPATAEEVAAITGYALARWFDDAELMDDSDELEDPLPFVAVEDPLPERLELADDDDVHDEPDDNVLLFPVEQKPAAPARPCTIDAAAVTDPRVHVLAAALREIECGGPSGLLTWGPTGMRDRARAALEECGLLSARARRRAQAEKDNALKSAIGH